MLPIYVWCTPTVHKHLHPTENGNLETWPGGFGDRKVLVPGGNHNPEPEGLLGKCTTPFEGLESISHMLYE